jgi:hypothetical protein
VDLISPEDFKKKKSGDGSMKLTSPDEFKAGGGSKSLQLIPPDEFKTSKAKTPEQPTNPLWGYSTVDRSGEVPYRPEAPVADKGTREQPVLRGASSADIPLNDKQKAEMAKQLNKELRAGFNVSPLEQGVSRLSEFTTQAINAAALGIPQAITGGDQRADYERTMAGSAGKLAGEFLPIAKGYKLTKGLTNGATKVLRRTGLTDAAEQYGMTQGIAGGSKILNNLTRGVIAGGAYSTAKELADAALDTREDGKQSIGERALNVGTEAAMFGAGDAALSALGPVARQIFEGVQARRASKVAQVGKPEVIQTSPESVSAMPIQRSTPKGELKKPLEQISEDGYLKPLSEFTDTLYRETSAESALELLPGSNVMVDTSPDVFYFSNKAELALGQGNNKGVLIEFDSGKIQGRVDRSKPAWEMAYKSGDAEFTSKLVKQGTYQEAVRSVTVKPDAVMGKSVKMRLQRIVGEWDKTSNPDGSVTYTRPNDAANDVSSMAKLDNGRPLLERGSVDTGTAVSKDVTKRSDVIADLSKSLNIPIRTGRFRQQAHGIHKTKSNVVRSKLTNDVPVIAHEVGHALDKRYQLSSAQFDSELLVLGKETSAPGYDKLQVRREGVAEFFRLLLTDPAKAHTSAPMFYARFTQAVSDTDMKALMNAQEQIRSYMDQDILNKSFSEMSVGKKDKTKLPSLSDLYTKFVDDLNPLKQLLKPLGEKGKRVFEDFWLLRGASGRAQAFLKQGRVDEAFNTIGKSFDDILKPVKQNLNEFRTYIKDKRAIELDERGIMTGSDLTVEERARQLRLLDQQFPQFREAHKQLKEYQDSLLKELIDSGMLTADDVAKFKEGNQEYVPFFRVFESEAGAGATKGGRTNTGSGAADQRSPIKRIKGSDREIVDPLESIIKNTYQYITIAERNKATRNLIDAVVNAEDLGGLVEKIPTPMQGSSFSLEELRLTLEKAGADVGSMDMETMVNIFKPSTTIPGKENIITVFREGKREFYQLDPDLYRAVTAADKESMNFLVRAANMPVRMLRSGIVNTLEFWFKNMFRDQFSALVNSKNGYIPYIDLVRGMYHVMGKTDTLTKFLSSGGAQGLRQSLDRKYLQSDMRSILATSMKDKSMNILKNPLEAMRALSEMSEMGTRVGEFSKGIKKDSSAAGIKQASVSARDLIDFGRAGSWGREINKVSAFWNAQVQGLDKTIRVFSSMKTAPKAFAKSVAYITAPTAALYAINKNDPRYQELPQWDKDMFWHLYIGDHHFRLPIPFELGVVFKVLPERLLSYSNGDDESFREFGKTVKGSFVPAPTTIPEMIGFITALGPIGEVMANKNFIGAPIVPRREEGFLPVDQAGPYTSGVAKGVARLADKVGAEDTFAGSPRKLDHIIQGYTGSLGKYATQGIDMATDAVGLTSSIPKPSTGLEDNPGFKAFVGAPFGSSTDSIDKFYDKLDKLDRASKEAEKRGTGFEGEGELQRMKELQKAIGDVSKQIRNIQNDPAMSGEEKTKQIRRLQLISNNFARMALNKGELLYEDVFK